MCLEVDKNIYRNKFHKTSLALCCSTLLSLPGNGQRVRNAVTMKHKKNQTYSCKWKRPQTLKVFKLCFGLAQLCALCAPISFCAFYCNEGKKKEIWMTFQISVSKAWQIELFWTFFSFTLLYRFDLWHLHHFSNQNQKLPLEGLLNHVWNIV